MSVTIHQTETRYIYQLGSVDQPTSKQETVFVSHFKAKKVLAKWITTEIARSCYAEIFMDTMEWDLAKNGLWIKKVVSDKQTTFKLTATHLRSSLVSDTLENIKDELRKHLKTESSLIDVLEDQVTLLVQRVSAQLERFTVRYDLVEYPEGDTYTVASTCAEELTQENQEFVHAYSPCNIKITEYLRRYKPTIFRSLVADCVIAEYPTAFYYLDCITERHPESIARIPEKWTKQQKLKSHLLSSGKSEQQYLQEQQRITEIAKMLLED